jgi:hypothetical protein
MILTIADDQGLVNRLTPENWRGTDDPRVAIDDRQDLHVDVSRSGASRRGP